MPAEAATSTADRTRGLPRELTAGQQALLAAVREEWSRNRLVTGPADRQAAEAGVRLAYRAAGLPPPERVIWLGSVVQGAVAAAILTGLDACAPFSDPVWNRVRAELAAGGQRADAGVGRSVRSWVGPLLWARMRAEVQDQVGRHLWDQVWALTGRQIVWQPGDRRSPPLLVELRRRLDDQLGWPALERLWSQAVRRQVEAAWCTTAAGFRRILPGVRGPEHLAGLERVAKTAGWWWPFERAAILTEPPAVLHHDEQGRLHYPYGPALAYPDGFVLHAWHGVGVPAELIARLADVCVEDIQAEPNMELRRVLLEQYGFQRYLRDAGAVKLHQDETGTLWGAPVSDDEPLVMVQVVNSTPEPDGTRRTYWLRVPPWTDTARAAVAWTFGLRPDQYQPLRES